MSKMLHDPSELCLCARKPVHTKGFCAAMKATEAIPGPKVFNLIDEHITGLLKARSGAWLHENEKYVATWSNGDETIILRYEAF